MQSGNPPRDRTFHREHVRCRIQTARLPGGLFLRSKKTQSRRSKKFERIPEAKIRGFGRAQSFVGDIATAIQSGDCWRCLLHYSEVTSN
jgi:hypothetical protein